ncbi:hypothetical protein MLGJGCBP_00412 [Rhodococcus sp. T7]|nr:hypothetical protein MLGJGCBP_00412 [Rhodococcus sp. T7]
MPSLWSSRYLCRRVAVGGAVSAPPAVTCPVRRNHDDGSVHLAHRVLPVPGPLPRLLNDNSCEVRRRRIATLGRTSMRAITCAPANKPRLGRPLQHLWTLEDGSPIMPARNSSPPRQVPTLARDVGAGQRRAVPAIVDRWSRATMPWAPFAISAFGLLACMREGTSFGVAFYLLLGAPHTYRALLILRESVTSALHRASVRIRESKSRAAGIAATG